MQSEITDMATVSTELVSTMESPGAVGGSDSGLGLSSTVALPSLQGRQLNPF
jgi:hypothetical protein